MDLSGTVALVTGGARRVGRAIVLELARGGCDVAIHYRGSASPARQLASLVEDRGRRAVTVAGDLSKPEDWPSIIQRTVDDLGRLDILVNNASQFLTPVPDTVGDFEVEQWEQMLRVNLVAPMALAHHGQPHLHAHGQGKIINLVDISADRPWPDHLAYCSSKAALAALTRGLARALAPAVQVNGIAPGIAVFPESHPEKLRESLIKQVPLQRAGTPEEVARLVRFIAESADFMTGQIIHLDGGRSIA